MGLISRDVTKMLIRDSASRLYGPLKGPWIVKVSCLVMSCWLLYLVFPVLVLGWWDAQALIPPPLGLFSCLISPSHDVGGLGTEAWT